MRCYSSALHMINQIRAVLSVRNFDAINMIFPSGAQPHNTYQARVCNCRGEGGVVNET